MSFQPLKFLTLAVMAGAIAWVGAPAAMAQGAASPVAMAFANRDVIPVDVTAIDVRVTDTTPKSYPFVGYRAAIPYDQAIKAWAAQRFNANGNSVNTLRITLQRGSITEKLLPITKGLAGLFKKEQSAEYTGTLEVELAIIDPAGQVVTVTDGKSWASQSVREDATTPDREAAWMSVIKTTFDNLDLEILPRMRQVMGSYVH